MLWRSWLVIGLCGFLAALQILIFVRPRDVPIRLREVTASASLDHFSLPHEQNGWKLLDKMIHYCRSRGTNRIVGQVLRDNRRMLELVRGLGFTSRKLPGENVMEVTLEL